MAYHWFIGLIFGLALAVGAYLRQPVQAHEGQTVDLIYFLAESDPEGVRLEWATASEIDVSGFRIKRATSLAGLYETVDIVWQGQTVNFVPAVGQPPTGGAVYEVWDVAAAGGQMYWYKLVAVDLDGTEDLYGPVSAVSGSGTPIGNKKLFLPILLTSS
jgi:hypothetical protein